MPYDEEIGQWRSGAPRLGKGRTVLVQLKMPAELLEKIDAAAEGNRSAWIRAALEAQLLELALCEAQANIGRAVEQLDLEREALRRRDAATCTCGHIGRVHSRGAGLACVACDCRAFYIDH